MKNREFFGTLKRARNDQLAGIKRPPLRSFKELADDLGVTTNKLRTAIARAKIPPPKPVFVLNGNNTIGNTWYEPKAFIAWWKAEQELKEKK